MDSSTQQLRSRPPEIQQVTSLNLPPLRTRRLPNSITLRIYSRSDAPIVYLSAIGRGGSAEAGSTAIAALTSIMQREGSDLYDANQIASILDYNGAWLKNDVSSHHSRQSLFSLQSRFADVLPVFADLVCRPVFTENALRVRREALARNIEVSRENVSYLARCRADAMIMGPHHPLAKEDSPEFIRQIVAEDLKAFHSRLFTAGGTDLLLCGDITPDVEEMVVEVFSERISLVEPYALNLQPFDAVEAGTITVVDRADASQSAVVMTAPAIPRNHPDYLPLHVAVYALGGYFGSRLMLNIREEKGLTYGIRASLAGLIEGAYIDITAETDNAHVGQLVEEVRCEMRNLAENPPQDDELMRLRQSAISSQASILDSPITIIDHYAAGITQGLPAGYFDAKLRTINSLMPETIATMARRYLNPENLRIAIAGREGCYPMLCT